MPRNNQNLIAKDIDGKKIREQYFDGIVMGLVIAILICCLFDIKSFLNNLLDFGIIIICFSPFILLAILNKCVFGKILCVLTEDKIYYFGAEIRMNSRHNKTNGYLEYNEIENVKYISKPLFGGRFSRRRVIISGENFEITVWDANRSLVKEINKRK